MQTNNATFGYTAESEQQFAISRIRAIEHGRSVVHVSTVGVSGVRRPRRRGHREDRAVHGRPAGRRAPVVRTERTPADRLGAAPEWLAAAALLLLVVGSTRARRGALGFSNHPTRAPRGPTPLPETARPPLRRVAVLIPTYNERDTLPVIVRRLREVVPDVDVVVLDDNSPGRHRRRSPTPSRPATRRCTSSTGPARRGWAPPTSPGSAWALDAGLRRRGRDGRRRLAPPRAPARRCSPRPRDADAVIGSRWVRGGSVVNWPLHRKALSRRRQPLRQGAPRDAGQRRHRGLPGLPRPTRCARWVCDDVASQGYCFQTDLTWRAVKAGLTVVEVPITFVEREVGDSKMSRDIMTESLRLITGWGVRHRARQVRGLVGGAPRAEVALAVSRTGATPYAPPAAPPGCCAGSSSPCSIVPDRRDRGDHRGGTGHRGLADPRCCCVLESAARRVDRQARGVTDLGRPAGGAAQRSDAEPSARRRRAGAHRRHAAADARASSPTSSASSSSCR